MATYYVSSITGSDTNAGTSNTSALATLQAASDIVKPGDTVEVMNGTYTGPYYGVVLEITTSGTASAPITFEAAPGQTPIIDSSGSWHGIQVQASYINIQGFTIVGDAANYTLASALANQDTGSSDINGDGISIVSPDGTTVPNHVTIQNNTIYNEPGAGISVLNADYVQILNNVVHDNAHWSPYGASGIGVGAAMNSDTNPGVHVLISGNISYNNAELVPEYRAGAITDGEGIILDTNPNFVGSWLVQNNTTYGNSGPGIESFLTDNATITGNTTYGDLTNASLASEGEIFINQSANNIVANNTTTPPSGQGTVTITEKLASDTGSSSSDLVTNMAGLTGTADPNATVTITEGSTTLGSTTAFANGAWSFTPSLTDGTHTLVASETNGAGTTGSASLTFTLDTVAPVVTVGVAIATNTSLNGSVSSSATVSGSGDPNALVTLKEGTTVLGTATADASGAWSVMQSFTPPLSAETHTIVASETDLAGNTGSASQTVTLTPPSTTPATPTHDLVLYVSEDAYQGDAQFTVQVDGKQVGGVDTATALHSTGASQAIDLGLYADGALPQTVAVTFLNDLYAGTPSTDRNLYVDAIQIDGQTIPGTTATLLGNGSQQFALTYPTTTPTTTTSPVTPTHDLVLYVSEDAYKGNAQFTVQVDGKQVGGTDTATALHSSGASQAFDLGLFLGGPSPHDVAVTFLNDKYHGSPSTDRNLYVDGFKIDGQTVSGLSGTLPGNGTVHFQVYVPV